jgi:hypothetical protein
VLGTLRRRQAEAVTRAQAVPDAGRLIADRRARTPASIRVAAQGQRFLRIVLIAAADGRNVTAQHEPIQEREVQLCACYEVGLLRALAEDHS